MLITQVSSSHQHHLAALCLSPAMSVEFASVCRYSQSLTWADGTIAYSVAKYLHYGKSDSCGVYCCHSPYNIKILPCEDVKISHQLCEIRDSIDVSGNKLPSGIELPPAFIHSSNHSILQLISCPHGHVTHAFLACDVLSMCFASRESESYDVRDIPSYTSCSVTAGPPAYKCATGGGRVPYTWVCDHHQDCSDNSDEGFCSHVPCGGLLPLQCGHTPQVVKRSFGLQ